MIVLKTNKMNLAELRKNSLIYSSKVSLIGIAVVYLLSLALAASFGDEGNFSNIAYFVSLGFFAVFTTIWGMFAVSNAVISELRNRTWVYQKMSAIRAFDMCVGKLFGPTLFQWLLGGIFITVTLISIFAFEKGQAEAFISVINLILATLLLHASAMVLSLLAIRRNDYATDTGNIKSAPMIVFMAIVVVQAMKALAMEDNSNFAWYGMQINPVVFNLVSLSAFMLWSMMAYYRNMREELQYHNKPYYWVAFNGFLLLFYGGLVFGGELDKGMEVFNAYFAVSFAVLLVATLLALFLEPINVISYNALLQKMKAKKWSKVFDDSPLWMISAAFSFVVCLLLCASLFTQFGTGPSEKISNFFLIPLVAFLFLVKSLLVNLYLHLAQVKRANFIWFLYMALWYGLLPTLFGFEYGLFIFYPIHVVMSGVAVVIYISILSILINSAIKKANVFSLS